MGVDIFKQYDKNDRAGTVKTFYVQTVENYRTALEKVETLNAKNKNPKIKYITGITINNL